MINMINHHQARRDFPKKDCTQTQSVRAPQTAVKPGERDRFESL
jgi:hypothetical protein